MKTELVPGRRVENIPKEYEKIKIGSILRFVFTRNNIILALAAFLLGRASLTGGLMPFGFPLFAIAAGLNTSRIFIAVLVLLGMWSGGAREQIYITAAAMSLFTVFSMLFKNTKSKLNFRYAVMAMISILTPEFVTVYLQGFLLFDVLKAILHGFIAFALVFIFWNASSLLNNSKKGYAFTNEEMISIAITTAVVLSGLTGITFLGFTLTNILCILVVLVFSFKCGSGVGAATGVTVGLITSVSSEVTPLVIASYAFCGLLSGVLRNLGKVGSGLGFVMGNAVLTLYLNGSTEVLIYLKEIVLAVFIFMLIPKKVMEVLAGRFGRSVETGADRKSYSLRVREMTVGRLNRFSAAFGELAKAFGEIAETKVVVDKQDVSLLFDRVADRVCKNCSLRLHCWDRNFYNTYQVMFKILEKLDSKGRIEEGDIPKYFLERCERIKEFVAGMNNIYEIFKVDMMWKGKIGESRGIVSQQLDGLARAISNLATEINLEVHFKSDLEDILLAELNRAGIRASEAIVIENRWGNYEINVLHKGCGGKRVCLSAIEKLASSVAGRKMIKEGSSCCQTKDGMCSLKLVEEEALKVTTGVAKVSKYNGMISGDSHTFMNTGDGKFIVALSDGMGTGQKAATQSRITMELLEQFMESGFDKDTIIKLINSILMLKSDDDSFATIDLSVVDLYSGEAEFVKIGAIPTFIKRKEKVEVVKSVSVPAGILSNIETELVHKTLKGGDFVIMLTDGILDALSREDDNELALARFIKEIQSTNPQEIADKILDLAYRSCDGKPADDMLVLAAKVWERAP